MPLDHPRVGMAKVARDYHERGAGHDRKRCPGVSQDMERHGWR